MEIPLENSPPGHSPFSWAGGVPVDACSGEQVPLLEFSHLVLLSRSFHSPFILWALMPADAIPTHLPGDQVGNSFSIYHDGSDGSIPFVLLRRWIVSAVFSILQTLWVFSLVPLQSEFWVSGLEEVLRSWVEISMPARSQQQPNASDSSGWEHWRPATGQLDFSLWRVPGMAREIPC